jgi:hypothetical protein
VIALLWAAPAGAVEWSRPKSFAGTTGCDLAVDATGTAVATWQHETPRVPHVVRGFVATKAPGRPWSRPHQLYRYRWGVRRRNLVTRLESCPVVVPLGRGRAEVVWESYTRRIVNPDIPEFDRTGNFRLRRAVRDSGAWGPAKPWLDDAGYLSVVADGRGNASLLLRRDVTSRPTRWTVSRVAGSGWRAPRRSAYDLGENAVADGRGRMWASKRAAGRLRLHGWSRGEWRHHLTVPAPEGDCKLHDPGRVAVRGDGTLAVMTGCSRHSIVVAFRSPRGKWTHAPALQTGEALLPGVIGFLPDGRLFASWVHAGQVRTAAVDASGSVAEEPSSVGTVTGLPYESGVVGPTSAALVLLGEDRRFQVASGAFSGPWTGWSRESSEIGNHLRGPLLRAGGGVAALMWTADSVRVAVARL